MRRSLLTVTPARISRWWRRTHGSLIGMLVLAISISPFVLAAQSPRADFDADRIVADIAEAIERRYVFADAGARIATQLRTSIKSGSYRRITDGQALANRLTEELRTASADGHLSVEYSAAPLPKEDSVANAEMAQRDRERYYGPQINFGFQRVELLPDNVGYLDLRVFAPLDWAAPNVTAAMTLLANVDALIVDLRQNGGGHGETSAWLMS